MPSSEASVVAASFAASRDSSPMIHFNLSGFLACQCNVIRNAFATVSIKCYIVLRRRARVPRSPSLTM
jgi:hypothetical protein